MVVVGGGYIGLEVAAVARKRGLEVVVLETMDRILARTTSERTAQHVAEVHASNGVEIRVNASVSGFRGNEAGQVDGVVLDGGDVVPADVVVLGVGVLPNEELAAEAGLAVDNGVVVDARGATSDPNVWAVGDCTRHPSRLYGKQIRLESVQNAMSQAKVVAANIAGNDAQYDEVPWFWTDQYDLKLQSVGLIDDADDFVTRGDPSSGSFTVFALQNGRIVGAESVNSMREHMECRRLAAAQAQVDSATLADPDVILKELP
jgi:3-phenylpropionate/trans-cinnamate dioxygenase ferredoxin reductase subunit